MANTSARKVRDRLPMEGRRDEMVDEDASNSNQKEDSNAYKTIEDSTSPPPLSWNITVRGC